MDNEKIMQTAIRASVKAGDILLSYYKDKLNPSVKESFRDVVTEVDKIAENAIIEILKEFNPEISIVTEEQGQVLQKSTDAYWIVDALDGTVNYINQIPFFAVSVAFVKNEQPVVGAIYVPMFEDLYYGAEGIGVFKNQKPIKINDKKIEESLFATSFSGKNYNRAKRKDEFLLFAEINDLSRGTLRTGSAALNLAYLAEGKFGGCWGKANKLWDVAAGLVLAKLAGAKVEFNRIGDISYLVNYIAIAPSSWDTVYNKVKEVIDLK